MHTREINLYGGLVTKMPRYALFFVFFTMANVGLPGTSGFIGEFLALIGAFQVNSTATALATLGIILSASYALWLCRRMIFGEIVNEKLQDITDVSSREKLVLVPLVVVTLLLGVMPMPVFDIISQSVENLLTNFVAMGN